MLIVKIYVNERLIAFGTARRFVNVGTNPDDVNGYLINEGDKILEHRYGDGAIKLVRKMLKYIRVVDDK